MWLWPMVAVAVVLWGLALFFFLHGRKAEPSHKEGPISTSFSVLSNPMAVCYTHNPDYEPPQLVWNHYSAVFNDENDIQLEAAKRNGFEGLSQRISDYSKYGLVPLQDNQYYTVSELKYSVPYLVPAARVMLNTIGKCFQDVLAEKYPNSKYKIIVTSVLRTDEDVQKLVRHNRWATENSCHKHGTTVDISYYNFYKVSGHEIGAYELKEALAIALAELRDAKLCYVKYERRNCFHVTLREMKIGGLKVIPGDAQQVPTPQANTEQHQPKPEKVYKNKDAERLHQRDEERKKNNPQPSNKYDQRPSPMI
ncbi:MAG: hypothetical protein IK032_01805 [Bacteroidales bacterium]|nr:hypothetical protein [Bacteroidales bacterium]MBR5027723.1 hypothetical protein [Bacteroidales bacterium]